MSSSIQASNKIYLDYKEDNVIDHPRWTDTTITQLVQKLIKQKITIRTAESCTGCCISNAITNIDGSSEIIDFCMTAYSPEVKKKFLGVRAELTTNEMIVSMATSRSMNHGLQDLCKSMNLSRRCEVYISITGWIGSNPNETGYNAIFTLCNSEQTLMSTFNVKVDIGKDKCEKKMYLVKRILLEVIDFMDKIKKLPC
jgi:PncC family amidohydrolase